MGPTPYLVNQAEKARLINLTFGTIDISGQIGVITKNPPQILLKNMFFISETGTRTPISLLLAVLLHFLSSTTLSYDVIRIRGLNLLRTHN